MDLYPWSFDSVHSHCHDDVISILNILKNFGLSRAHLRDTFKKSQNQRDLPYSIAKNRSRNVQVTLYIEYGLTGTLWKMKNKVFETLKAEGL
jgi:hypothetical protein